MSRTLENLRVWMTRDGDAGRRSARRFEAEGAVVTLAPTLRIEPCAPRPEQLEALDGASVSWVALTSPSAAEHFAALGLHPSEGGPWRCVAVGAATAARARDVGLEVHWVSPRATGTELAEAWIRRGVPERVLIPGSDRRREELPERLRGAGVEVFELTVHRTVSDPAARATVDPRSIDLLVAYSPSALAFCEALEERERAPILRLPVAAIGPTTVIEAERLGFAEVVAPEQPGEETLLARIAAWWAQR